MCPPSPTSSSTPAPGSAHSAPSEASLPTATPPPPQSVTPLLTPFLRSGQTEVESLPTAAWHISTATAAPPPPQSVTPPPLSFLRSAHSEASLATAARDLSTATAAATERGGGAGRGGAREGAPGATQPESIFAYILGASY
jgi:hypothetical protein